MKKILLTLLLIIIPVSINATITNQYFEIDLPDGYVKVDMNGDEENFKWSANNENKIPNVVVSVKDNKNTTYNVSRFTDKDIEDYKSSLETSIMDGLKSINMNIKVSVQEAKKETINNQIAIVHYAKWDTKDSFGYDTYQKGVTFTTKNKIYSITFSSYDNDDLDSEELNNVLSSFKLKDTKIGEEGFFDSKTNRIITVGVVAGIIGYIISALINSKKKRA